MKWSLSEFEKLAKAAKRKHKWNWESIYFPVESLFDGEESKFIAYCGTHADEMIEYIRKLEKVVEAARNITNIYYIFKDREYPDLMRFYKTMQDYCDEYGAMHIHLKALERE